MQVVGQTGAALDNVTIFGTVNSGSSMRVHLSNPVPMQFTLKVEAPEAQGERSSDPVAGSYTVMVKASGGGKQREARFGLNINIALISRVHYLTIF